MKITFSREIEAVNPDVSIATTSGSGLGTGRRCLAATYHQEGVKTKIVDRGYNINK
jgi:hypothetical protein